MSRRDLVIVTGTSGGLGGAIVRRLIAADYDVVGVARRAVTSLDLGLDDAADRYHHRCFDLADTDGIAGLVSGIVAEIGRPYALVNNAALGADGMLPTMHNSEIETMIAVNVTAPIVLSKYAVRHMLSARRGRIVNISSIVARTGYRGLAAYGASKAALEGLTRSLARDVGPRNVTVNAVAPGFLPTDMTSTLGDDNLERIRKRSALGRFAELDHVAAAVEYLLSEPGASVTGTTITVDGGSTA
jgi:3-oxoacyl-[acyl-carrier protein] reductase